MLKVVLPVIFFATALARPQGSQEQNAQARQITYNSPYPVDLQYDFSLLDPQLQYPAFAAQPRLQPQVLIYPGGAPGQPFLLQPGAPPGNFLYPQPQPGFVLRDAPQPDPSVFLQGHPRPYVPPINKDAEEIPTGPNGTPQITQQGKKPEKIETFDESPEISSGETDIFSDRTPIRTPSLKPGHRFFILNGQPLFSNYPLPQFSNSPYQPTPEKFENDFLLRQSGPSFLPEGFNKPQLNEIPSYKDYFQRNTVTGQINNAKPNFDFKQNDVEFPQNFISFNSRDEYKPDFFVKSSFDQKPKFQPTHDFQQKNIKSKVSVFKLRPIEVPDEDENSTEETFNDGTESIRFDSRKENNNLAKPDEEHLKEKSKQENVAQSEPSAIALAGPGGVASAAPRATALSGDKGLSVSSPKATAIAGPAKEKDSKPTKAKKEKQ